MSETVHEGSTWADVARDAIAFWREDPISFFIGLAFLVILFLGTCWWIFPRATKTASDYYDFQIRKSRQSREQPELLLTGDENAD